MFSFLAIAALSCGTLFLTTYVADLVEQSRLRRCVQPSVTSPDRES